uniref:Uncharacterized protein n=1 Tax=Poecilia formosa TaxID=48698 RepID=A0A096LTB8_POEFO
NSTIIALGVLTFALQLCFILLFMLRCWRLERRVQEALQQPDSVHKLSGLPYYFPDGCKQNSHLLYNDSSDGTSHSTSCAIENYKDPEDSAHSPSIPWDLVQH